MSCALHLQRSGQSVTLIDPRAPGTATSFGNAGGIVTGAVTPNSTSTLWRDIPRMLFDRDSAVRVRWRLPAGDRAVAAAFLLAGRHSRVQAIADALHPLVTRAYDAHRELITLARAEDLVRPVGWLKVFETEAGFAHTQVRARCHGHAWRPLRRAWLRRSPPARTKLGASLR